MTMPSKGGSNEVVSPPRRLLTPYDPALDDADRLPLWSFLRTRWKALVVWALAAAFVVAYTVWAIFCAPGQLAPVPDLKGLNPNETVTAKISNANAQNSIRTTLIGAIAGATFLTTGFFAWRQVTMSRLGQLTDRFTKSIENLGAESSAVRLAGVYGLEQLSTDHRFCRPAAQVLTAFVREASPGLKADVRATETPPFAVSTRESPPGTVIVSVTPPTATGVETTSQSPADSALRALSAQQEETGPQKAVSHEIQDSARILISRGLWRRAMKTPINLAGAELPEINLPGSDLTQASLPQANLRSADLRAAILSSADLRGADLTGAYLQWATLDETHLEGATLIGAWLNEANGFEPQFENADLYGVHLLRAKLIRANFRRARMGEVGGKPLEAQGATLIGADFSDAELTGADFRGANLTDADFTNATLDNVKWQGAKLDRTTGIPPSAQTQSKPD